MEARGIETRKYAKHDIIFLQGEDGSCMYDIVYGRVGIYANYATPEEKLLTELTVGSAFGEMAMIEAQPRSATAVALEDGATLQVVTWETLGIYFRERPAKVVAIMQQMSRRIRELTADYLGACKAITEMVEKAEEARRKEENAWMQDKFRRYIDAYQSLGGGMRG